VGNVDDVRFRRDAGDDALHGADEAVGEAEIGGESDDGPGHAKPPPWAAAAA